MALSKPLRVVAILCVGMIVYSMTGCGSKEDEVKDIKHGGDYYTGKDFQRPGSQNTQKAARRNN